MTGVPPFSSIEHYHALDDETDTIVHVHAYYAIITGESLAKNYQLPVESMLLGNTRQEGIIPVPALGAELIIFVLRMLIKHTTFPELVLLSRRWSEVRQEVNWLMTDAALEDATELLRIHLPDIEPEFFRKAFEALRKPASLWRRIALGYRVRARLRSFARSSGLRARWIGAKHFAGMVRFRLAGSSKKLTPAGGGALIAFVGSEATGKSTLLREIERWLGQDYTVRRVHAGKPPSTLLTFIPHTFLPILRRLFPEHRSTRVQVRHLETAKLTTSLLFATRSVMLAYERKAHLTRAFDWSKNGVVVLSDRYPSAIAGAPDSPQLTHLPMPSGQISLRRRLAGLEARLYREIPSPDLVFQLSAPLEVTLARNEAREKTEAEDYVRFRHSLSSSPQFDGAAVYKIATDQPFDDSVKEIKEAIWSMLQGAALEPGPVPDYTSRSSTSF
jgi:thymidylate kinase